MQVPRVRAAEEIEQQRRVGDCMSQWPEAAEAVEGLRFGPGGDPPALGLDPHEPRPRRRDTHGARAVGTDRGSDDAGGDGRRRAAARSSRGVVEIPGVACHTEREALGKRIEADLGRVGLTDDHRAGRTQTPHELTVSRLAGKVPGAAERGRLTLQVDIVLDRKRDAQQRRKLAGGEALIGAHGLRPGLLGEDHPEGPKQRLELLRTRQRPLHERNRGDLTGGELLGLAAQRIQRV